VEGDLLGHDTHGLALLAGYVKEIESGGMTRDGAPEVLSDRPAAVLWDGMRLPGPWLVEQGLDLLIPRARDLGTASLVIRRSHHIACLAVYMLRALEEDMLMLLACSDPNTASVAPFGGTQAVFTPNPLAMGFPLTDGGVMVDISASITTNGMSNRKRAAGETFAEQWLIDAEGRPSNDPQVLFEQPPGTLLPVGGLSHGHKGYGMALLVETLTGGLAGHGRADAPEGWGATVYITLHDLNDRYRRLFLTSRPFDRAVRREHTDICNAALDRNADLACGILREHIERTGANIRKALLKNEAPLKQAA
ncbi:MAG: FCD domain-containing protein, partial [Comamonadaceae bacterium]